jgi:DNA-binding response OmpR family regulator
MIILDVRMPRMTGYEACKALKENPRTAGVPIIFLSAKGQEAEVQAGLEAGATAYILKPFAPDELLRQIGDMLKKAPEPVAAPTPDSPKVEPPAAPEKAQPEKVKPAPQQKAKPAAQKAKAAAPPKTRPAPQQKAKPAQPKTEKAAAPEKDQPAPPGEAPRAAQEKASSS